jgi:hypothetical protein
MPRQISTAETETAVMRENPNANASKDLLSGRGGPTDK